VIKRSIIHAVVGIFNAVLLTLNVALGLSFTIGFLFYENTEQNAIDDHSYIDIRGWLIGLAIYSVFYLLIFPHNLL